ncbi:hypothetical protein ACE7GA_01590 [Roseomonas sp. CCTCC AB2023176]|uniref:hypothetical protein n=1 Tax=Roseomonas sp. CCTCC AB2023176 TaxID=3342640 RepID=UPI0035D6BEE6
MTRKAPFPLSLLLPVLLAACGTQDPLYRIGVADYGRGLALEAPFVYGRTDTLAGDPLRAARAARDVEGFAYLLESDPLWQTTRNGTLQPQMQIARRELRAALGMPDAVPSDVAAARFGAALEALAANNLPAARDVLTPLAGPGTLDRLSALPRLRRVEEAAAAMAAEASQSRNPGSGRG